MSYEINMTCKKCGHLDYESRINFKFCPDCGDRLSKHAHCLECGLRGSEKRIFKHHCICKKHNRRFKSYGGLFGDFECPKCRKLRLAYELKRGPDERKAPMGR